MLDRTLTTPVNLRNSTDFVQESCFFIHACNHHIIKGYGCFILKIHDL